MFDLNSIPSSKRLSPIFHVNSRYDYGQQEYYISNQKIASDFCQRPLEEAYGYGDPRTTIQRECLNLYGQEIPEWRFKTNDNYLLYRKVEKDSPTMQSYPCPSTLN